MHVGKVSPGSLRYLSAICKGYDCREISRNCEADTFGTCSVAPCECHAAVLAVISLSHYYSRDLVPGQVGRECTFEAMHPLGYVCTLFAEVAEHRRFRLPI